LTKPSIITAHHRSRTLFLKPMRIPKPQDEGSKVLKTTTSEPPKWLFLRLFAANLLFFSVFDMFPSTHKTTKFMFSVSLLYALLNMKSHKALRPGLSSLAIFHFLDINTTVSTWAVNGNMSTGWIDFTT
jgi:hypothetical protein